MTSEQQVAELQDSFNSNMNRYTQIDSFNIPNMKHEPIQVLNKQEYDGYTISELRFTLNDGYSMAAKRWTPSNVSIKQSILGVHGWLDNANSFALIAPTIAKHGFDFVAVDLLGTGQSDHIKGSTYSAFAIPRHLLQVVNILQWKKFIYMGHSLGGGIGALFAAAFSERLIAFIALDVWGLFSALPEQTAEIMRAATMKSIMLQNKFNEQEKTPVFPSIESVAQWMTKKYRQGLSLEGARCLAKRNTVKLMENDRIVGFQHSFDKNNLMPSPSLLTEDQVIASLTQIKCPTLILIAKNGWPFDPIKAKERLKVLSKLPYPSQAIQSQARTHHLHLSDPELVLQDILPFLKYTLQLNSLQSRL
eukprot:gb/GECH01002142.1/.p1 GENE.gb/GECH01002142.1/~~gb/GECH01002142.1/.p1  ORF type:complete len:362 (+),score=84.28 gb/GECH01002142.1/:1-1086(+)